MVLSLLVGLFVFTAFAEGETDCANGKHTPGEFYEAAYTPCFGGFKTDYYTCSDCGCFCDGDGNQVFRDNGTGVHTPGEIHPADYLPCQGGYKTDYYTCSYCGCFCDESGNQVFRESGTGVHRPGKMYPSDYTECGGGTYKEDYYLCADCGAACDVNGSELHCNHEPGTGKHTPGQQHPADYTKCYGGIKEDYYICSACGLACDVNGSSVKWEQGAEKHTPGEKSSPNYTECAGGYKTDYYICSECHSLCDKDGNLLSSWEPGTGKHTPGEYHPADYTSCGGGYKESYYICSVCGQHCDKNGGPSSVYFERGTGKHAPGAETYPANYTECGGGFKTAYHICTVCGNPCDENGNDSWDHAFKHHTPLTIPAKAATVDAEGNIEYVKCTVCGNTFKNVEDAQDDIRCSMKDVTLPKLPAEDKPAETTPPEETTPPDENEPGHKVEIDDNVTEVPDSISDKYESVEAMSQEMLLIVMDHDPMFHNSNAGLVKTKLIEVSLMVETENGWEPATEANFPAAGVTVTLPYPKGVGRHNHVFAIAHMITTGERAGEVEIVPCTATKDGLRATFHSLSPVMIVYREKTAEELAATLADGAAETGDEGLICVWLFVLAVSGTGLVLLSGKKARASKR